MPGIIPEAGRQGLDPAIAQRADALRRRASHLHMSQRMDELEVCLKQILELIPNDSQALYNLALLHHGRGELSQADYHLRVLIAHDPDYLDAYLALGGIYYSTRQLLKAIIAYESGLKRAPTRLPLLAGLLLARLSERVPENIKSVCERIVAIDYENPDANTFLAWSLIVLGEGLERALECADRALTRDPQHPQANAMRYQALIELQRHDEADLLWKEMSERAKVDWTFAKNVSLIASQLRKKTRLSEIPDIYLEHHPEDNDAIAHMANTVMMEGDFASGYELTQRVAKVLPDNQVIQMSRALTAFRLGKFDEFHKFHHTRWARDGAEARWNPNVPEWDGTPLPEKALLVYSEQGIGDHVMWASFMPVVQSRATKVYFETSSRLNSLFSRSFPEYAVISREYLPKDWSDRTLGAVASAADIPMLLDIDFKSVPGRGGFLIPDAGLITKLRARYQEMFPGKKLVGISWRSGNRDSAAIRSLELAQWGSVLQQADCAYINLQYGDVTRDIAFAREQLGVDIFWDKEINPLGNMDPFAAQIAALDLVVSVDNSTIHFAGAIGKPTWALLPVNSDWRWLADTREALWYQSLELFRQKPDAGWDPLMAEVADRLHAVSQDELAATHVAMLRRCGSHAFEHGRLDVAEDFYRALLRLDQHKAEALHAIGRCARVAGHPKDAVAILAGALEQRPDATEYRAELALALDGCGEVERAERLARDAVKRDPMNAAALLALGRILCRHQRDTEATDYFARILRGNPRHVEARIALAQSQVEQGEWEIAQENFLGAIRHAPLEAPSHVAFAEAALRMGEFEIGWEHFRWRFGSGFGELPSHLAMLDPKDHPAIWTDGNLRRARLHLRAERNPVDQLLLTSHFTEVQSETRSLVAEADPQLLPLLELMFPKAGFLATGSATLPMLQAGKISMSSSLGDLARRFRPNADKFPGTAWFDRARLAGAEKMRAEYQQCFPGRSLVGLAWRGEEGDDERLLPMVLPLLQAPEFGIVSLQRAVDRGQLAAFAAESGCDFIVDPRVDPAQNLTDFAAQIAAVDIVVAVDDFTAVLAAALGCHVVKVASGGDHWAWGNAGSSCLWQKNVHIIRQVDFKEHWVGPVLAALRGQSVGRKAT